MHASDLFTGAALFAGIALFGYYWWTRRSSAFAVYVAFGCLGAGVIHADIWLRMIFDPGYADHPQSTGMLIWPYGLGWGLLAGLTSITMYYAMVGALRPPSTKTSGAICIVSAFMLANVGVWTLERWISLGSLPTLDLGLGPWPAWIGFPTIVVTIIGPFVCAIPWSLSRPANDGASSATKILARYWLMLGTAVILVAVLVAAVIISLVKGGLPDDRPSFNVITALVGTTVLIIAIAFATMLSFRRTFLIPAMAILEGIQKDLPVAQDSRINAIWRPLGNALDDRARHAAEHLKNLNDSQAQMHAFLENAPVAMSFLDPTTLKIVMINRCGAGYYGQTPEKMLGKDVTYLRPHYPDFENVSAQISATLTNREAQFFETLFTDHKGEPKSFLCTSFPVMDSSGSVELLGQIFVDVTEQRRAESAVNELRAQLIGFFDNLPTSIYLKNIDHKVVYVSKHLAIQYGKTPEQMIGQYEYDLHIDEMKPYLKMMDDYILSTGQAFLAEGEHLQFKRQELVSRFPIFNDKGEITHIGGMNFDIDDRAKAQAAMEQSKALFEAFIRNNPDPMVLMDITGKIVMLNDAAASYYGQSAEELTAAPPVSIAARWPEYKSVLVPATRRFHQMHETQHVDTLFKMPSGEIRNLAFSLFPIFGTDRKLAFIGTVAHDLTEERRAQADLVKSTEALHQSEKLAALGSMLAGVSHELNNPLSAVIGQAALLGEDLEDTEHADRVSKIRRAADRCARIVQSFLAMARQKAPDYQSVDLGDQIRAAVELTEYQMRAAGVTMNLNLVEALPAIKADPDQLHQVIVNLLTNARQALEDISGERMISITTSRQAKQVRLTIADNGKGIDAATRDRIFDPFFTTKAVGSGTGIGLSYSLGIIEAHGGTLKIEDADVGTVFVVTLPIGGATSEAAAPESAQSSKAKGRVLIIDDEEDVADTLADMLQRMGMGVTTAVGGIAGQAALADGTDYDVILSDIRMPDFDGPALYAWMADNRPDLTSRIAFVTGDTFSGVAADFLEQSQCRVLEKPFTPAGLRELIAAMLT